MALLTGDLIRLVETPKERAGKALASLGGIEGVAKALDVDLSNGLDGTNAAGLTAREQKYGKNYIEPEKPNTFFQLMWHAFQDLTIIILTISGLISVVLGLTVEKPKEGETNTSWIEGASIMLAVLIVTMVTAVNDYQKEKQFRALNAVKEDEKIKVIRNGKPTEVSKFSLVVGDIVRVDLGDIIPADGIVFDESDLKIDESAMTGESVLLTKNRTDAPFLLSGTKVMEGVSKMLVVCVGESSQAGIISKLIMGKNQDSKPASSSPTSESAPTETTPLLGEIKKPDSDQHDDDLVVSPLQGKLDQLTVLIGKLGLGTAFLVFLALVVRFSITTFYVDKNAWSSDYLSDYLGFFIIGITVLVVAIPEGLPLAVTIALAFSVKKMLKDNNLVRHLDACETMGSATTICSDKTGTLTTNRMTVVECYVGQKEFSSSADLNAA
ncbi:P-type ATPase (P-ATPase) Superfamily, partial [Thraustotheca clavata]